ncbi:MAG: amino acid ABC transporter permease [Clostridia bacterium]|nr:amino acid ABC transporter permease [Clostridia bacterium]MBQ7107112.1 amino acid ABC transporter permease [Clostridia bacterium]
MHFDVVLKQAMPMLLEGLKVTIIVSLVSLFFGMLVGLLSCLLGLSKAKVLRAISAVYVWLIRGTPMIVQAFIVYYGVPIIVQQFSPNFIISETLAAVITLSLNAGAYLSEIFRSGIQAVDVGQIEASRSLGISSGRTMMAIVLPQAFKITIPSIVNQFIITVKDTSILSVISLAELCNQAKQYSASTYLFFETYILVGVFYLAVISVLMLLSKFVEKKVSYDRKG